MSSPVPNRWDAALAPSDPLAQLVYASNLLGSDPRVTNFGGGNTSAKIPMADPLTGETVEVLWVKGSGGDLGSANAGGFASLYQDKVVALEAKGLPEDEIVALYNHCTFNLNPRACSIDTPLHAFVPYRAVSHLHADAVIAIAASRDAERLCREVWGGRMGYLPWKRPGFDLGLMLRDLIRDNPGIEGALMGSHGYICWADDWEKAYALSLDLINQAEAFIASKRTAHPFGEPIRELKADDAEAKWRRLLPVLRGRVAHNGQRLIASVDQSEPVLEFLGRAKRDRLAALGTSCPDHFLRTKIRPLVLDWDGVSDPANVLAPALEAFREDYRAYYERCKRPDSPAMRNPNPSVVLVPGLGMVSFGKNAAEARITGEFYRNAIAVMEGAETVDEYVALPEQEAFDIEYWLLEEAKLKRQPPEAELSRQIAVITGAAQGIGLATARQMASLGATVVLLDLNASKLSEAVDEVAKIAGKDAVLGIPCDVTDSSALTAAFDRCVLRYGGVDLLVVNAGNARRGTVADTSCEDYDFLSNLLMRAYFETMAEASRVMIAQGTGGSMVVVASKNGSAAGSNAAVYSAAKAFELHLARCSANDLAKFGIRVNAVNPDAVLQGSGIWSDEWRTQTAASLGIAPEALEAHYRDRSLLKVMVRPEDIAEAIVWLSSSRASRTTGSTISVDGGNREGFLR